MFKNIWSIVAIAAILISSFITKAPPLVFGATIVGILFVLGVAFKKNWSPLLGAILSVIYAILSYQSGFFANAAMNLFLLTPIQLYGWYHWVKKKDSITVLSTYWKHFITVTTIVGMSFMTMVAVHTGSHLPFLDGPSSVLVIASTVLLTFKTKEQWYGWIPYNLIECIMWFFAMSIEPSVIAIFVMRAVFLINSLIGAREWFKNE